MTLETVEYASLDPGYRQFLDGLRQLQPQDAADFLRVLKLGVEDRDAVFRLLDRMMRNVGAKAAGAPTIRPQTAGNVVPLNAGADRPAARLPHLALGPDGKVSTAELGAFCEAVPEDMLFVTIEATWNAIRNHRALEEGSAKERRWLMLALLIERATDQIPHDPDYRL
jgi:hypothetical protein